MASSQWDAPLVVKRDWTVLGGTLNNFKQKPRAVLRRFCLDRHENSKGHQAASKSQPTDSALHLAPSQESFEEFLTQTLQGQSVRDGGVTSDKRIKMRWALTEAILARNRKLLADSQSMTLLRNERKGKLLVRFRAVLRDLSTVSGCFGLLPVSGSADSIALATDTLMEAYCTPMRQPPRASRVTNRLWIRPCFSTCDRQSQSLSLMRLLLNRLQQICSVAGESLQTKAAKGQ
jgi:hypothetical protein